MIQRHGTKYYGGKAKDPQNLERKHLISTVMPAITTVHLLRRHHCCPPSSVIDTCPSSPAKKKTITKGGDLNRHRPPAKPNIPRT